MMALNGSGGGFVAMFGEIKRAVVLTSTGPTHSPNHKVSQCGKSKQTIVFSMNTLHRRK